MNSQQANELKPQRAPHIHQSRQRIAAWFSKPSFSRFKLNSSVDSSPHSTRSVSDSNPSSTDTLSIESSSTLSSKTSIHTSNQGGVALKTSSKVPSTRKTSTNHSSSSIRSTATRTTSEYNRRAVPIPLVIIPTVPGYCF